jgi:geranylgeranyl pyrophosphate synthase
MKNTLNFYQNMVTTNLSKYLEHHSKGYDLNLLEAIKYATLNNGKRIRPALVYALAKALNIPLEKLDSAAMAIEFIHCYSLIHDDLPAMDNDELRRGIPTCHIKYTEATAILVGDAQQSLAYECIANDKSITDNTKIKLIKILTQASGLQGMIGGQYTDIESTGKLPTAENLKKMHRMKTGALIKAGVLMGACQSPVYDEIQDSLANFADNIGLAFQVHDDILDLESNTKTLGKPINSDADKDKATFPKLMGLKQAKVYREQLINNALVELSSYQIDTSFLIQLTLYISQRVK